MVNHVDNLYTHFVLLLDYILEPNYVQFGAANCTVCGLPSKGDRILVAQEILSIWHCCKPHQSSPHAHVLIYTWMHMWIVTYIVHDSSTRNIALSSVVWSSQFNTKISKITAKLYFIVCHQHPCHSKELLFYLIWIQKHFIFDLFFRYQQFMKMFQAMEMKIPQGWVRLIC